MAHRLAETKTVSFPFRHREDFSEGESSGYSLKAHRGSPEGNLLLAVTFANLVDGVS